MEKVFVYGSLMTGLGNHRLLSSSHVKGSVISYGADRLRWPGKMLSLGGFPGLLHADQLTTIVGEVYEVNAEVFQSLDWLEGYPRFYNREIRKTKNGHEAWVYFLNDTESEYYREETEVVSGDWRAYLCG